MGELLIESTGTLATHALPPFLLCSLVWHIILHFMIIQTLLLFSDTFLTFSTFNQITILNLDAGQNVSFFIYSCEISDTHQLSVPTSKVSIYRDGPSSAGKNQLCVIQLIIVQFLYSPRFLIIHKRYNRQTGKRIIYTPNGDITECGVLFWSQVIMQDSGITCSKWVMAALWSVIEDALLNHVQEHQAFCVNSGCDVTQLPLKQ